MNELIKKRINENKKIFTKKELKFIYNNVILIKKVYIIGFLDNYDTNKT